MSTPEVSIIIPSYNSRQTILSCLECLDNQVTDTAFEVILVDSSDDGTADLVEKNRPQTNLIRLPEKTLPGKGRNIGASHAKGEILAFTDSDCLPESDWLAQIVQAVRSGKSVIGGSVENVRPESMISRAEYYIEFREFSSSLSLRKVRFIPTCNFAIRTDLFESTGGFPDLRASEDTFFCHTLSGLGYDIWFDPAISIRHLNRNRLKPYLRNQHLLGKYAAIARKLLPMPGGFFVKAPWLFPMLPIVRSVRTIQFILKNKPSFEIHKLMDFIGV